MYKSSRLCRSLENVNSYSTDEEEVGTWVDGRKIYKKSYECTTSSSEYVIDSNMKTNVADILEIKATINNLSRNRADSSDFVLAYVSNNMSYQKVKRVCINESGLVFVQAGYQNTDNCKIFATVYYMKK